MQRADDVTGKLSIVGSTCDQYRDVVVVLLTVALSNAGCYGCVWIQNVTCKPDTVI